MKTKTIDIVEIEEYYEIHDGGKVYSKRQRHWMKPTQSKTGYLKLPLYYNSRYFDMLIHRLVATKFVYNPYDKLIVNHLDGDRLNNWSYNLEWCTQAENKKHGFDIGLTKPTWLGKFGEEHSKSKIIYQYDLDCNFIKEYGGVREAGRALGRNHEGIKNCARGISNSAYGYRWSYKKIN